MKAFIAGYRTWLLFLYLGNICMLSSNALGQQCAPIDDMVQKRIIEYVSARIVSSSSAADIKITSVTDVEKSCYHKLVLLLPDRSKPITLYLSPDLRFLSSAIYDLTSDPRKDVALIGFQVDAALMRDKSPQLPGSQPRLRVVEFGDLQCPYCKQFDGWYKALPAAIRDHTTLVFKHLPLPQHGWAQIAARYSACTAIQSQNAFWSLTAFLFQHQAEISPGTVEEKMVGFLGGRSDIKLKDLSECIQRQAGAQIVDRDKALAHQLAVGMTPTLFINGRRAMPIRSESELEQLLAQQLSLQAGVPSEQNIKGRN